MRQAFLFFKTIIIFLLIFVAAGCGQKEMDPPCIGIVSASKLSCRQAPRMDAPVIKYFYFGTPLDLIQKSETKSEIDGVKGSWYREKSTKGWVFGGYLLTTAHNAEKIARFEMERIRCNVVCGGLSCFAEFNPLLAGDYYIAEVFLNDYPQDNEPESGIVIGRYAVTGKTIKFMNPVKVAGYDGRGRYIDDILSRNFDAKEWITNKFERLYVKSADGDGTFYCDEGGKKIDRKELRNKCQDKTYSEEIWADVYTWRKVPLEALQKSFPLVAPSAVKADGK